MFNAVKERHLSGWYPRRRLLVFQKLKKGEKRTQEQGGLRVFKIARLDFVMSTCNARPFPLRSRSCTQCCNLHLRASHQTPKLNFQLLQFGHTAQFYILFCRLNMPNTRSCARKRKDERKYL